MDGIDASGLGSEKNGCQGLNGNVGLDGGERAVAGSVSARRRSGGKKVQFIDEKVEDGSAASLADERAEVVKQNHDRTLQDFYEQEGLFDDDDADDSDWELPREVANSEMWYCTNCTSGNKEEVIHCNICGEYRKSELLKHGYFAAHFALGASSYLKSDLSNKFQVHLDLSSAESKPCNRVAFGFDERMLLHCEVENKPHPERPDRLRAILASLKTAGMYPDKLIQLPVREIDQEELRKVHSHEHVESIDQTSSFVSSYFNSDTYANEHSALAARLAAGICADLATKIMSGCVENGFALVRPPGHHAGVHEAMGFCLHNNAAVAASAAKAAGAERVLIVDWDVHHGNGTQEIFEADKSVLYVSLHRHDEGLFYPGTGSVNEVGTSGAEGFCVNVPWRCGGVGDGDYIFAFKHIVLPIAKEFSPDLTIISAGFDAARGDPLGGCDVTPSGYGQMTNMLGSSTGKLLVILEGGYNLRSISSSATAVIRVLLGENPRCEVGGMVPSKAGLETVLEVLGVQRKFWPNLDASYVDLLLQWKLIYPPLRNKSSRKGIFVPYWWRWGRKRMLYHSFRGARQSRIKL